MIALNRDDILELDIEIFSVRLKEMEDEDLQSLADDIAYEMVEANNEVYVDLDNKLGLVEFELDERLISLEELEMMRELVFEN